MKHWPYLIFLGLLANGCSGGSRSSAEGGTGEGMHPGLILTAENLDKIQRRADGSHQHLFRPVKAYADEFCRRGIPAFENAHNRYREMGDGLPSLALMYRMSGDQKYLDASIRWVRAFLDTESWRGSQNLGRSSWMIGTALIYDWLYEELEADLKERILERLISESEIILEENSGTRALSNHLLIETSALGIAALLLEEDHPRRSAFLEQADAWTMYIINHAPTDGSWGEGVQYWQYGTGYFLRFLEAARTTGYKDYYQDYEWLKKTGYFPIYFSLPGRVSKVVNFSDCGTDRYIPAFLLYKPASLYRNGYFQDYGMKVQSPEPHKFSWLDFLYYDATLEPEDFTNLPRFKHFEDHGFITTRSGWERGSSLLAFRCGPAPGHRNQLDPARVENRGFGPGHQHPNTNSFLFFGDSEWLVIDPGYTHLKETRNHNTLLVNGHGQAGAGGKWLDFMAFEAREPAPAILYAETNEVYDYMIGDAGNIYVDEAGLKHFRRHLMFIKPDLLIVLDDLEGKENSQYNWLLQFNEIADIDPVGTAFRVTKNEAGCWVVPVLPETHSSRILERELDANDVHGLPGHPEGILRTISLDHRAEKTRYLVVIGLAADAGEKPRVAFEDSILEVKLNGRTHRLRHTAADLSPGKPLLTMIND